MDYILYGYKGTAQINYTKIVIQLALNMNELNKDALGGLSVTIDY